MYKKKVTSSDVARKAGVSQSTVSMVLNKKYNVSFSKDVVHKVEEAARELGYELPKRKRKKENTMSFSASSLFICSLSALAPACSA